MMRAETVTNQAVTREIKTKKERDVYLNFLKLQYRKDKSTSYRVQLDTQRYAAWLLFNEEEALEAKAQTYVAPLDTVEKRHRFVRFLKVYPLYLQSQGKASFDKDSWQNFIKMSHDLDLTHSQGATQQIVLDNAGMATAYDTFKTKKDNQATRRERAAVVFSTLLQASTSETAGVFVLVFAEALKTQAMFCAMITKINNSLPSKLPPYVCAAESGLLHDVSAMLGNLTFLEFLPWVCVGLLCVDLLRQGRQLNNHQADENFQKSQALQDLEFHERYAKLLKTVSKLFLFAAISFASCGIPLYIAVGVALLSCLYSCYVHVKASEVRHEPTVQLVSNILCEVAQLAVACCGVFSTILMLNFQQGALGNLEGSTNFSTSVALANRSYNEMQWFIAKPFLLVVMVSAALDLMNRTIQWFYKCQPAKVHPERRVVSVENSDADTNLLSPSSPAHLS